MYKCTQYRLVCNECIVGVRTDIWPLQAEATRFQPRGDLAEEFGTGVIKTASLQLWQPDFQTPSPPAQVQVNVRFIFEWFT